MHHRLRSSKLRVPNGVNGLLMRTCKIRPFHRLTEPAVISATVLPTLDALTDQQTPADGFNPGTYESSEGTISSQTPVYLVDGVPQSGAYDLVAGETVQVREDVLDSVGNSASFFTAAVVVTETFAPVFTTLPAITPSTGQVGAVFTISLGSADAEPPVDTYTPTLMLDAVDVTSELVGLEYTSTAAGTLTLSVEATNAVGSTTEAAMPATVSEAGGDFAYPDFGFILGHDGPANGTVLSGASGGTAPYIVTNVQGVSAGAPFVVFGADPDPVYPDQVEIDGADPQGYTSYDWEFSNDPDFATVNISGTVSALPAIVDLSTEAQETLYFRLRGTDGFVVGAWPATAAGPYTIPAEPSSPLFSGSPTITPGSGAVGTVFTISLGEAQAIPPVDTYTPTLLLDAADVTSELVGLEYTSTTAGVLTLSVEATNVIGSETQAASNSSTVYALTVPGQFLDNDWDVFDAALGGTVQVRINSLPSNNGATITEIRYSIDGAGDNLLTASPAAGDFAITGLTDDVAVTIRIWAVNSQGAGPASDPENVTPTTPATPFAYPPFSLILGHNGLASGTVLAGASGGTEPYVITNVQGLVSGSLAATGDTVSGATGESHTAVISTTGSSGTVETTGVSV